jgi:hypothetical protein
VKHIILLCSLFLSLASFASEKLRLIAEQNIPTGEKFKETEIGGLSGIVFDSKKNRLLAVSDDRSQINNARFYEFDFTLDEKNFSVKPVDVVIFKNKDGLPFKKMAVDFEGITFVGDDLLISSEGGLNREPPIFPGVFRFTRSGEYKANLDIPEKFLPAKAAELKKGARDNLSFEALSTTKDGKFVFVGTEEALNQDSKTSTTSFGSTTRIILYNDFKPTKEFGYLLDPVPSIKVGGLTVGETGLVDIAAIDENNFYSMERSYLPLAKKVFIKIFINHIDDKTTEISKLDSIKDMKITPVTKVLLSNLDEFSLKLDNVEGLCFGPVLANGHKTLIAVSDNNFSKTQRTEFLAFEIIP